MDLQILGQRRGICATACRRRRSHAVVFEIDDGVMQNLQAMGMLGTNRHTFRNIAGHVDSAERPFKARRLDQLRSSTRRSTGATLPGSRERFGGPVIVKGILDPDDARQANFSTGPTPSWSQSHWPPARQRPLDHQNCPRSSMRWLADRSADGWWHRSGQKDLLQRPSRSAPRARS